MSRITKVAIVGYGLIGKRHADVVMRSTEMSLAAVVEPDEAMRSKAAQLGVPLYSSIEDLFATGSCDGVILATPTPLHIEQGLLCIAAGCPVLIEKPIAVFADDARVLTDAAERKGVPLLVGHHRRHNGMVQAAKNAIEEGVIGEVRSVQATCWFYKPDHYFEIAPWRTKKGAGPISVNLVHDVDLLRHLCGEVLEVRAASAPSARGFENEDLASAILTFDSGTIATISVSDSIVAPWSWELTARENPAYPPTDQSCYLIGGSLGGLSLPDLRVWRHQVEPDWWTPISATSLIYSSEDPLVVQARHFANVIEGKAKPLVSGIEGLRSLEVVEAIAESAVTGMSVRVSQVDDYEVLEATAP